MDGLRAVGEVGSMEEGYRTLVLDVDRTRSGLHGMAVDLVRNRRLPANPEVMTSECEMLSVVCRAFSPSVHGFSTTLMASMFSSTHLSANLSIQDYFKLISFLHTGQPQVRSAFDGCDLRMEEPQAAIEFEEFAKDLLTGDSESVCEAHLNLDADEFEFLQVVLNNNDDNDDEGGTVGFMTDEALVSPLPEPPQRSPRAPPSPVPKKRDRSVWSRAEDDFVLDYYAEHGPLWREMSKALVAELSYARSDDALRNRYERLTLSRQDCASTSSESSSKSSTTHTRRPSRAAWTKEEDEKICATVSTWSKGRAGWQELARELPGRTPHAVRNRANRMLLESQRAQIVEGLGPR